jgi:AraC-like DNA-binding protein
MNLSPSQIICIIAIFQLIVFVISLLSRKFNRQPNRILAAFLIFQAIICFDFLVKTYFAFQNENAYYFLLIGDTAFWVVSPLLYFYVRSLCYSNFKFHVKDLFHLTPAVIIFLMIFLSFITAEGPLREIAYIKRVYNSDNQNYYQGFLMYGQFLIYNILSLQVISNYRKKLKMQVSSIFRIFLTWLKIVIVGFMVAWIVNLCVQLFFFFHGTTDFNIATISFAAFLIFFNVMFFKGWTQPDIFTGVEETPKYQSSGMTISESEKYLKKLSDYIEKEKPYLDPELSLRKLSDSVSIPIRLLLQLINGNLESNFYDFINSYRIETAKKLLIISEKEKTISEIFYESGFNSKSSFNAAFKKETGMTPSEFRNKNRIF